MKKRKKKINLKCGTKWRGVRVSLVTGPESEMDASSSKRTWLQHMCCILVTPDVLICRKRKERLSQKEENDRKRGWN
jgi:hypothetical protein